ncbi:hypothetical protein AKJ16_DCAP09010 [Drosera capensis]
MMPGLLSGNRLTISRSLSRVLLVSLLVLGLRSLGSLIVRSPFVPISGPTSVITSIHIAITSFASLPMGITSICSFEEPQFYIKRRYVNLAVFVLAV